MYTTATPDRTDLIVDDVYYFVSDKPALKIWLGPPPETVWDPPGGYDVYYAVYYPEGEASYIEDPNYPIGQYSSFASEGYDCFTHDEALDLPQRDVIWCE